MSQRYTRLFSLSKDLQLPGSPVMIPAGVLARDNQTGKVLVQLKFRNLSNQPIKTVKIKINAYDSANRPLAGVASYTYSDLNIEPNGEFGTNHLIPLPDTATGSFTVEILHVDYIPSGPVSHGIPEQLPHEGDRAKGIHVLKKADNSKIFSRIILICALVSMAFVTLYFWRAWDPINHIRRLHITGIIIPKYEIYRDLFFELNRSFYAMIIPFIALIAALFGRKNPTVAKTAAIVCSVFLGGHLIVILWSFIFEDAQLPETVAHLTSKLGNYIYGLNLRLYVSGLISLLKRGSSVTLRTLWIYGKNIFFDCLVILSDVLPTAALLIFGFRIKNADSSEESDQIRQGDARAEAHALKRKRCAKMLKIVGVISLVLVALSFILYFSTYFSGIEIRYLFTRINNIYLSMAYYGPRYALGLLAPCVCLLVASTKLKPGVVKLLGAAVTIIFLVQILSIGIYGLSLHLSALLDVDSAFTYLAEHLPPSFVNGVDLFCRNRFDLLEYYRSLDLQVKIYDLIRFSSGLLGVIPNLLSTIFMLIACKKMQ